MCSSTAMEALPARARRVASPALGDAGAAKQLSQRHTVEGAIGDDAVVRPMIGDAVEPPTFSNSDQGLTRLTTARVMQLRRIEIGKPDLDPSCWVRGGPNAEAVAIPNIANGTFKPHPVMWQWRSTGVRVCGAGGKEYGRPESQGGRLGHLK